MNAVVKPLPLPLCVDCDGSLLRTDLLHEAMFALLKKDWTQLLRVPLWLLRGKATLKQKLAERVQIDASTLPYNEPLVAWLREQRSSGREIVLATASPRDMAEKVAAHLGLFDRVVATDNGENLSGAAKGRRLSELYGERGFDYVGNSQVDLAVWESANGAILVSDSAVLRGQAGEAALLLRVFGSPRPSLRDYLKALRLHQWLKNLLVFVPLVAAHQIDQAAQVLPALLAFLAFGLCASSVYVLNDLLDLPSDRTHVRKRERAFASGRVPLSHGAVLVPLLLLASATVALFVTPLFQAVLAGYFAITLAYSTQLKQRAIVDVIVLAMLYTVRVLAGSAATGIVPTFWLLAFSMFLFLSLAIVKRYSEMRAVLEQARTRAAGRGYEVSDLPLLMGLGCASGIAATMVLALYVNSPDVTRMYAQPYLLWLMFPLLLYWICRIWLKTHRGEMHDDPVVFAMRDRPSLMVFGMMGVVMALATARLPL